MLISVIICTYNRSAGLGRCLDSLLNQKLDRQTSFEIVVVDNNSTDDTRQVVQSYTDKASRQIQYVFEPRQGKTYALNTGIGSAKGDILAFSDDDTLFDSAWLFHLMECFQEYSCDGVGGRVLPQYPPQTPQWIKDNAKKLRGPIVMYDFGEDTFAYQKPQDEFIGANWAFKRKVFDDCGLFHTDMGPGKFMYGDDTEFFNRAFKSGKKFFYCGQALVWHPVDLDRMNFRYFARWNTALGRYRVLIDQKGELETVLYCFGIPRYLVRVLLEDFLRGIFSIFNRKQFLEYWNRFFMNWGRAAQIHELYIQKNSR